MLIIFEHATASLARLISESTSNKQKKNMADASVSLLSFVCYSLLNISMMEVISSPFFDELFFCFSLLIMIQYVIAQPRRDIDR